MVTHTISLGAIALPVLLGLGAAALGSAPAPAGADPVRCGIETATGRGLTTLTGVLASDKALEGTYRFRVTGSGPGGRSQIQQGGPFHVAAGETLTLGEVTLNADTRLETVFTVTADGRTIDCAAPFPHRG